ncbi:MAG: WD40 repeat domain-containing protein, partial [Candidatus Hodarchaeota archaeon]
MNQQKEDNQENGEERSSIITLGEQDLVKISNFVKKIPFQGFHGHVRAILSIKYSPNGKKIVTASADDTIRIWDANTGNPNLLIHGHLYGVSSIVYLKKGSIIASAGGDGIICIWNADTGQLIKKLKYHRHFIDLLAISPNGRYLASIGRDDKICIYDLIEERLLITIKEGIIEPTCIDFSPDSNRIVTCDLDIGEEPSFDEERSRITVWDIISGNKLINIMPKDKKVSKVAFSPDGKHI